MEINELYIKSFGKFTEKHFLLHEGVHVFYGENEYGKSTIYAFIKAMLFGLERGRGRAAQNDEFSRYEPWDNPNYYAGVMRFSSGGKDFRLERYFDRYSKGASLVCENDGEQFSLEDGDLEILLGGITKADFENTVAIGQLTARPGQELAEALKNYAANYYETGSSQVDLQGALEYLRQRRKSVEQELRVLGADREQRKHNISQKETYISKEIEKLQNELNNIQKKLSDLKKKLTEEYGRDVVREPKSSPKTGAFGLLVLGVLVLALGILATLSGEVALSAVILILGVILCCAGGIWGWTHNRRHNAGQYSEPVEGDQGSQLETDRQKLQWQEEHVRSQWMEKKTEYQNLLEELEEAEVPDEKSKILMNIKQALLLAEEKLLLASQDMTRDFGDTLNHKASAILERITGGKYTKLFVDESLNMSVFHEGRRIPVERVSKGTIEQIYFALRMASSDILCEEPLPIISDDAFAYYDEKRLKFTIKWLSEQSRQVIIFSCQKREIEIVKQF